MCGYWPWLLLVFLAWIISPVWPWQNIFVSSKCQHMIPGKGQVEVGERGRCRNIRGYSCAGCLTCVVVWQIILYFRARKYNSLQHDLFGRGASLYVNHKHASGLMKDLDQHCSTKSNVLTTIGHIQSLEPWYIVNWCWILCYGTSLM